jgi:hypothetical protein
MLKDKLMKLIPIEELTNIIVSESAFGCAIGIYR